MGANAAYVPVSVIIPCYCCADSIERAVASVMAQTLLPEEMILVDDASADEGKTADKLRRLKKQFSNKTDIKLIFEQTNGGPAVARNTAWNVATKPFIAFLDADDVWHPKKLDIQYHWMQGHPNAMLCGHRCHLRGQDESVREVDPNLVVTRQVSSMSILLRNPFNTPTIMLRTHIPHRFPEGRRYSEDYLLWQQLIFQGYQAFFLDALLAWYHKPVFGGAGLSGELWNMELGELANYRVLRQCGHIGWLAFVALTAYSLLKFLRRLIWSRLIFRASEHPSREQ